MKRYIFVVRTWACTTRLVKWDEQFDNWKTRQHPNLVSYCGSAFVSKYHQAWIMMEYSGIGSVADVMSITKKTLNEAQIAIVCKSMLKGLEYIIASGSLKCFSCGDLRASAILLTDKGEVKLGNYLDIEFHYHFSYRKANTERRREVYLWMAPEVTKGLDRNLEKTSVWSLGITLIQMSEGKPPHADESILRAFFYSSTGPTNLQTPEKWSNIYQDFVNKCLTKDAHSRASIADLLQHPFITEERDTGALLSLIDEAKALTVRYGGPEALMGIRDAVVNSMPLRLVNLCCVVLCRHYPMDRLTELLPTELFDLCAYYNSEHTFVVNE
eukprot:TRINITY_DN1221_c0_g2_i1.p1 TRINITY_DN1221_c0_g2~~TRINITY_DN1221_c0_g2_i1.p1  ORF type:complete len:327 (+),score=43.28 TRINITY_DN1221_c0_g2_i1:498-1478(+)